jgi:hypothetical protein
MALSPLEVLAGISRTPTLESLAGLPRSLYGSTEQDPYSPNPQEEQSLLQELASSGMGALQYAGETLTKPSRALWGTLEGLAGGDDGGGLWNLMPFSDSLEITDPSKSVEMGQFLENRGILPENEEGFDRWDIARFGADVVGDPLSWLTGGASAIGKGGRVLKAMNRLDDVYDMGRAASTRLGSRTARATTSVDDVVKKFDDVDKAMFDTTAKRLFGEGADLGALRGEKVGYGLGIGLPFKNAFMGVPGSTTYGKGADWLQDVIGRRLPGTSHLNRARKMAFSNRVGGQFDQAGQDLAETAYTLDKRRGHRIKNVTSQQHELNKSLYSKYLEQMPSGYFKGATEEGAILNGVRLFNEVLRDVAERTGGDLATRANRVTGALDDIMPTKINASAEFKKALGDRVDELQKVNDDLYREFGNLGGNNTWLDGNIGYFPRSAELRGAGKHFRTFSVTATGKRAMELRQVTTLNVNRMVGDAEVRRLLGKDNRKALTKYIREKYDDALDPDHGLTGVLQDIKVLGKDKHAKDLAKWMNRNKQLIVAQDDEVAKLINKKNAGLLKEYLKETYGDLFSHGGREKFATWAKRNKDMVGKGLYQKDVIQDMAQYHDRVGGAIANARAINMSFERNFSDAGMPLREAFEEAGLDADKAIVEMARRMDTTVDDLAEKAVSQEAVNAATSLYKSLSSPEWSSKLTDFVDYATRMFKKNVTMPFPAFHMRNFVSGQMANMLSGEVQGIGDMSQYAFALAYVQKHAKDPDFLRRLGDHTTLGDAHQKVFLDIGLSGMTGNAYAKVTDEMLRKNLPSAKGTLLGNWKASKEAAELGPISEKMRRVPGARMASEGYGAWMHAGEQAAIKAEFYNRAAMFQYLTKHKRMTDEAAGELVDRIQLDYSALSGFEKGVMKRMMPFYAFTRLYGETMFKQLYERPGGPLASMIKGTGKAHGDEEFLPDYLKSTTMIKGSELPVIGGLFGKDSYITGFGMAHENPLAYLGGGPRRAIQEGLSAATPIPKTIAEYGLNQSFFQHGRSLDDLKLGGVAEDIGKKFGDKWGRMAALAEAALPTTRYSSTYNALRDADRTAIEKIMGLTTGFKSTSVGPQTSEAIKRDAVHDAMKGTGLSKGFEVRYIPTKNLEGLTGEQARRSHALRYLAKKGQADRKKRAAMRAIIERQQKIRAAQPGVMDWIMGLGS